MSLKRMTRMSEKYNVVFDVMHKFKIFTAIMSCDNRSKIVGKSAYHCYEHRWCDRCCGNTPPNRGDEIEIVEISFPDATCTGVIMYHTFWMRMCCQNSVPNISGGGNRVASIKMHSAYHQNRMLNITAKPDAACRSQNSTWSIFANALRHINYNKRVHLSYRLLQC